MATAPYGVRLLVGAATVAVEETMQAAEDHPDVPDDVGQPGGAHGDAVPAGPGRAGDQGRQHVGVAFSRPRTRSRSGRRSTRTSTTAESTATAAAIARRRGDGDRRAEGRFALYSVPTRPRPPTPRPGAPGSRRSAAVPPDRRWRPNWTIRALTLAQLRARLQSLRRRRTRSPAGLRAGHQGPCAVPDAAGQQDHPRDREVTRAANSNPNSAENPLPVRAVAIRVAGWIDKLGTVWVEGQLAQINDAARLQDRVHGAARPGRRHVADRDLSARPGARTRR